MNRAVASRLSKLEARSGRTGIMHVVPAASDEEYRAKRDTLIREHGAHPDDIFIQVLSFQDEEPFTTGKTAADLLDHVAQHARRIHDTTGTRR